jgi:hypothetical protein
VSVLDLWRGPELPTSAAAELGRERRRTAFVRLALAALAVGLLGAAFLVSRDLQALPTTYFASGSGGIVVLDLSSSVDQQKAQRAQRVIRSMAETEGRIGLVVFSDTAYEMLPPDTRSEELRPILRFFEAPPGGFRRPGFGRRRGGGATTPAQQDREESPWSLSFRGGTKISTGLAEARAIVHREGDPSLSVLLLSDLDNSGFDSSALTEEVSAYEREGLRLRVIPLFPAAEDRDFFERVVGEDAVVDRPELVRNTTVRESLTLVGASPWALLLIGTGLLALLAVNERYGARLAWGRAT